MTKHENKGIQAIYINLTSNLVPNKREKQKEKRKERDFSFLDADALLNHVKYC